jgi:hypothetical protein
VLAATNVEALAEMDRELGPLWDAEQCQLLQEHVNRGCMIVMARVY